MKKPSSRILEIIESKRTADGGAVLNATDVAEIEKATKSIDRRDQQLRAKYLKPAKKPARKVGR